MPRKMRFRDEIEPDENDECVPSTQEVAVAVEPKEEDDMAEGVAVAERLEEAQAEVSSLENQLAQEQAEKDAAARDAACVEANRVHAEAAAEYEALRGKLVEHLNEMSQIAASMFALRQTVRRAVGTVTKHGGQMESTSPRFFGTEGSERDALERGRSVLQQLGGRA